MNKLLLDVLKQSVREKYKFKSGDVLQDVKNCINILYEEIHTIYKSYFLLQGGFQHLESAMQDNDDTLCHFCAKEKNDVYTTSYNLYLTMLEEFERVIANKESDIFCILVILLQSRIEVVENLFNFEPDKINSLKDEQSIWIIERAISKLSDEFMKSDENILYFDYLIDFLNLGLSEML